jgi:hypothetical protein
VLESVDSEDDEYEIEDEIVAYLLGEVKLLFPNCACLLASNWAPYLVADRGWHAAILIKDTDLDMVEAIAYSGYNS